MNQAQAILQQSSGKLSLAIEAIKSGNLSEEAQFGLQAILGEVKADLENAGRQVQLTAALAQDC